MNRHQSGFSPSPFDGTNNLRLTLSQTQVAEPFLAYGQAYTTNKVPIKDNTNTFGFSTVYQFRIYDNVGSVTDAGGGPLGADGIVFILQDNSNNPSFSPGNFRLGFLGMPKSFGIEVDTFFNVNIDPGDPAKDGNHVAVLESGNLIAKAFASIATPMNNGNNWTIWVDYDGTTPIRADALQVRIAEGNNPTRPSNPSISYQFNIETIIGNVPSAFVGFASAVGAAASTHEVISWKYRNEYRPYDLCGSGNIWNPNTKTCYQCTAGTFRSSDQTCCLNCAAGFFSSVGANSCSPCPSNKFSSSPGQSSCQDCNCVNGVCNATTGFCTCNTGYQGTSCNQCQSGRYGPSCLECPSCVDGKCNDTITGDGKCICDQRYTGILCEQCAPGFYGSSCDACPSCVNGTCSDTKSGSGKCICNSRFSGNLCNQCTSNRVGYPSCTQCATGFGGPNCENCETNCSTCPISTSVCTSCSTNFYLHNGKCVSSCPPGFFINGTVCSECSQRCATCEDTATKCMSCKSNRNLSGNNCNCLTNTLEYQEGTDEFNQGLCFNCSVNCNPGKCQGTPLNCTECSPGNQFIAPNVCGQPNCSPLCSPGQCQGLDPNYCTTCADGLTETSPGVCEFVVCSENCKNGKCTQNNTCDDCLNGFQLNGNDCLRICEDGCQLGSCNATQYCTNCANGFENINGDCLKVCEGCLSGKCNLNSECSECNSTYYLNGASCTPIIPCDIFCKSGPTFCLNNGSCSSCNEGYVVSNGKCVLNNGCDNCASAKCFSNNQCQQCNSGFYLENGKCFEIIECSEGCESNSCNPNGKCTLCSQGYRLDQQGKCILNDVCGVGCQNTKCFENGTCTGCINGWYLQNRLCRQIIDCSPKCLAENCTLDGSCSECSLGYLPLQGRCILNQACGLGCELENCYANYTCGKCYDGYYISGGNCLRILDCDINCLDTKCYLNGTCGECRSTHYLDGRRCLIKQSCPGCKTGSCFLNGTCSECLTGYYNDQGICVACMEFCSQCTNDTCNQCNSGYEYDLTDSKCIASASNSNQLIVYIAVPVVLVLLCLILTILLVAFCLRRSRQKNIATSQVELRNSDLGEMKKVNWNERTKSMAEDATVLNTTLEIALPGFLRVNFKEQIRVEERLGQGGAGVLYKGVLLDPALIEKHSTDKIVVKFVSTLSQYSDEENAEIFKREVSIMWSLSFHQNIVTLVGYCDEPTCIVIQQYDMDLHALVHGYELSIEEKFAILKDISAGLAAIHEMGVCHRDIKTSNVLIQRQMTKIHAVICDFGLAIAAGDKSAVQTKTSVNVQGFSPRYTAPEVFARSHLRSNEFDVNSEKQADVYAFAIIIWEVLSKKVPWQGLKNEEIEVKVRSGERPSPIPEASHKATSILVEIMQQAWTESASSRPTIVDIHSRLDV